MSGVIMEAVKELMLVIVTVAFSTGYQPPKRLKKIMSTPEFESFIIFAVLYMTLENDVIRAATWAAVVYCVDRYFRNIDKNE